MELTIRTQAQFIKIHAVWTLILGVQRFIRLSCGQLDKSNNIINKPLRKNKLISSESFVRKRAQLIKTLATDYADFHRKDFKNQPIAVGLRFANLSLIHIEILKQEKVQGYIKDMRL